MIRLSGSSGPEAEPTPDSPGVAEIVGVPAASAFDDEVVWSATDGVPVVFNAALPGRRGLPSIPGASVVWKIVASSTSSATRMGEITCSDGTQDGGGPTVGLGGNAR